MIRQKNLFFKSIGYSVPLIFKSSKLMILLYLLSNILQSTLTLLSTFILKYVLDSLTDADPQINLIFGWVGLYALSLVVIQANMSVQNILYDSVFKKAENQYECNLARKLAELPLSVIDSSEGKDMVDDVRHAKNTAVYTTYRMVSIVSRLYTFIVAFITLIKFNVWFSFLFLSLTVPGIILNKKFDKKAENLRREKAPDVRKFSYYRWMLTDAWPAKDVRMYDLTNPIKARYDEEKKQYLSANKRLDKQKVGSLLFAETIRRSGETVFIIFVVYQAINGMISIGDIALYIGFALTTSNSFNSIVLNLVMGYTRATTVMGRVFDFFTIHTERSCGSRSIEHFDSLAFDNVYFKYPHTEKYVLSGVSFTLNCGDKLSIVGINGSGKSTIIKLMLGLYEIDSGRILINGYPMSDYDIKDVRKLFSALFQNFVQYPITLRENIALSDLAKMNHDSEIESALRQSGVYNELQPKLENGLDSFMTRQFDDCGTELSKGQWQKIALARAYFKNAPIVIFDEPSAALDAEAEDRIFKNFAAMSDGKTGIMISHRISSARISNKIIVLNNGKITEHGTHEELVALGGLYARLYNLQREKYTVKEGYRHDQV